MKKTTKIKLNKHELRFKTEATNSLYKKNIPDELCVALAFIGKQLVNDSKCLVIDLQQHLEATFKIKFPQSMMMRFCLYVGMTEIRGSKIIMGDCRGNFSKWKLTERK